MKELNLSYNFSTDEKAFEWVDSLYIKYDMPHGYRAQLEHLAVSGVENFKEEQIPFVQNILKYEGFTSYTLV